MKTIYSKEQTVKMVKDYVAYNEIIIPKGSLVKIIEPDYSHTNTHVIEYDHQAYVLSSLYIMPLVKYEYRIATVVAINNTYSKTNYYFKVFDMSIVIDDYVLCDTIKGPMFGKVISIDEVNDDNRRFATREIMCKCDLSYFFKRKATKLAKA